MAWRKGTEEKFPPRLRSFREADWPQVPGECLERYSCHGEGYDGPCAPRPGESCGQLHLEALARDHPDRPEMLANARRAHAFARYHQARLAFLGTDHPDWVAEYFENDLFDDICYAHAGDPGGLA